MSSTDPMEQGYEVIAKTKPNFWHHLHLQDPTRFVFANQYGLIVDNRTAMATIRRISSEIHRNLVQARDEAVRTKKAPYSTSKTVEFLQNALNTSAPRSDVALLLDANFMLKIVSKMSKNEILEDPTILERFREGFNKLSRRYQLRLGDKSVEMLAARFLEFVKEIVSQILYLKNIHISFANIPVAVDFFRDSISQKVCHFDCQMMLKRLQRDPKTANFALELIFSRSEHLIDFVFDLSFQRLFSASFKRFFGKWINAFKERLVHFNARKNRQLRSIPHGATFTCHQLPELLHDTLADLLNDSKLPLFTENWVGYVFSMIWDLNFEAIGQERPNTMPHFLAALTDNHPLCDRLSMVYQTSSTEEQRTVLAQLFRFVLKFTSDLIRLIFNVQFDEEGRIAKIVYEGFFEKVGNGGKVVDEDLVRHLQTITTDHPNANTTRPISNDKDQMVVNDSPILPPPLMIPKSILINRILPELAIEIPSVEDVRYSVLEKTGEMNKIRNWNRTLTPIVTAPAIDSDGLLAPILSYAFPSPPPTPDSTTANLFNTSCPPPHQLSLETQLMRGRQMNSSQQAPRRHPTPKATPRAPSPDIYASESSDSEESDTETVDLGPDNNSNEPEPGLFGVDPNDLPAWVLYNYPIIATCIDNNDVYFDFNI